MLMIDIMVCSMFFCLFVCIMYDMIILFLNSNIKRQIKPKAHGLVGFDYLTSKDRRKSFGWK